MVCEYLSFPPSFVVPSRTFTKAVFSSVINLPIPPECLAQSPASFFLPSINCLFYSDTSTAHAYAHFFSYLCNSYNLNIRHILFFFLKTNLSNTFVERNARSILKILTNLSNLPALNISRVGILDIKSIHPHFINCSLLFDL